MKPSNGGKNGFNIGRNIEPAPPSATDLYSDQDDPIAPGEPVNERARSAEGACSTIGPKRRVRFDQKLGLALLDKLGAPLLVMIVILSETSSGTAQNQLTSFALYSQLQVESRPLALLTADVNADGVNEIILLSRMPSSLSVYQSGEGGAISVRQNIDFPDSCDAAAAGYLNSDSYADVAVLFRQARIVRFYFGQADGTFREGGQFYLDGNYDNVVIADITQDHRSDIILYGKKTLGLTVLPGNGDGTFRLPTTILRDVPVGKILVQPLNNDGISDLVVLDWVANSISFYYGNGIGGFSEETSFHLSDDIDDLEVADLDGNTTPDLAVVSSKSRSLYTFFGTGGGAFLKAQILHLSINPDALAIADINGDGRPDICAIDRQSATVAVYMNNHSGQFGGATLFATGSTLTSYALGSLTHDRVPDFITADRRNQKLDFFWNNRKRNIRSNEYALGHEPAGITAGDFNQDGFVDVGVAQRGSAGISILFGGAGQLLNGQIGIAAEPPVENLSYIGTQYGRASFIGSTGLLGDISSEEPVEQLSVYSLDLHSMAASVSQIQKDGISWFAHGWLSRTGLVNFLTMDYSRSLPQSMSYYEQIRGSRFIEKNYSPAPPGTTASTSDRGVMLGATVSDVNNDNHFDMVYVVKERQFSRPYLAVSFSDSLMEIHERRISFYFPDTAMTAATMAVGDCNNDGYRDLLISVSGKGVVPKLYVALNRGDSTFALSRQVIQRVQVSNPKKIKLRDADGDGNVDILLLNETTKSLLFYKGKGDGTFFAPRAIADEDDVGDFECTGLGSSGVPRLLISNPRRNTLQILTIE